MFSFSFSLGGDALYTEWDPACVQDLISRLNPEGMYAILHAQPADGSGVAAETGANGKGAKPEAQNGAKHEGANGKGATPEAQNGAKKGAKKAAGVAQAEKQRDTAGGWQVNPPTVYLSINLSVYLDIYISLFLFLSPPPPL